MRVRTAQPCSARSLASQLEPHMDAGLLICPDCDGSLCGHVYPLGEINQYMVQLRCTGCKYRDRTPVILKEMKT